MTFGLVQGHVGVRGVGGRVAGEAVEQGNLRKQTAVEQIEWRQTIDAKSSPFPPPRPFPPPPPTTHPTNCSKHFPQTFFQLHLNVFIQLQTNCGFGLWQSPAGSISLVLLWMAAMG